MVFVFFGMLLLFLFNYIFIENKMTYPPNVFVLTFGCIIFFAIILNSLYDYNDINLGTLSVILSGCFCFTIGGVLSRVRKKLKTHKVMLSVKAVKISVFLLLLYYPLIYSEFNSYNSDMTFAIKILRIREQGLDEQLYSIFSNNMIIFSGAVYLSVMYLYSHARVSVYWLALSLMIFVAYSLLTGTRATIIFLVVSSIFLYINQVEKINKKLLFAVFLTAFFAGGVIAVFMGKDGADRDKGIVYNVPYVLENYFSYGIQGIYLFDNYVLDKYNISPSWDVLVGSKQVLNKFGTDLDVKSKHADFSSFGNGRSGNVYTIYFAVYPLYGLLGVCLFFTFYGFVSSALYYSTSSISSILLGYINGALVIGIFNEQVFTNILYTVKLAFIVSIFALINKVKYEVRGSCRLVQS